MKVPYHNDTDKHVHIGPVTIAPRQTRDVEETHIPDYKAKQEAPADAPADPLAELLKGSVKKITVSLDAMSTADIEALGALEQKAESPRTTLLSAIGELLLTRAAQADMLAKVAALSDEELAEALAVASAETGADPDYLSALEAEAAKRNPGAAE